MNRLDRRKFLVGSVAGAAAAFSPSLLADQGDNDKPRFFAPDDRWLDPFFDNATAIIKDKTFDPPHALSPELMDAITMFQSQIEIQEAVVQARREEEIASPSKPGTVRVAFVVGHNRNDGGAYSNAFGEDEYGWNGRWVRDVIHPLAEKTEGIKTCVFHRRHIGSYNAEIRACYDSVAKWKPHVTCEVHFNSAHRLAKGTETLYWHKSSRGKALARYVNRAICEAMDRPSHLNRGAKPRNQFQRGGVSLRRNLCPNIIIEPGFYASNSSEAVLGEKTMHKQARMLVTALRDWSLDNMPIAS